MSSGATQNPGRLTTHCVARPGMLGMAPVFDLSVVPPGMRCLPSSLLTLSHSGFLRHHPRPASTIPGRGGAWPQPAMSRRTALAFPGSPLAGGDGSVLGLVPVKADLLPGSDHSWPAVGTTGAFAQGSHCPPHPGRCLFDVGSSACVAERSRGQLEGGGKVSFLGEDSLIRGEESW